VPHLDQNRAGNQNTPVNFSKHIGTTEADEIVERAGIGNNDHARDYPAFVASSRSNVAMS
jgi:hypothetical protein